MNDNWELQTPLHDAALYGHVEAISMLLERGADVNSKDVSNYYV